MDKGAHYFCCDFQAHSPRDINWKGADCTSNEERSAHAQKFVALCRDKGLGAVAITDHHDLVFFPYIREAAAAETDAEGNPVPENDRLVVFPGMELTLGVPCQALLLLDADFESEFLEPIYTLLAINAAPASEPKTAETTRLNHITTLSQLHEELDERSFMMREGQRRYIILPNVGNNGQFSVIRTGMQGNYIEMPCVGGYVDGTFDRVKAGYQNILAGKDKNYGNKPVACFQTSDNRSEDGAELGTATTWVKWAEPTAEALRQACLAQQTRISHGQPTLPSLRIESMNVSNSSFMGPVDVEFNPQFNCIIGGRGTGKSTILEYLRWALCDQPPSAVDTDDVPDFQAKRRNLIDRTLKQHKGSVRVQFIVNGVRHAVKRDSVEGTVRLKVGDGSYQDVREQDVRSLLAIDAYSQKQLSVVGVRTDELLRFIETPIKQKLDDIHSRIGNHAASIKSSYGLIDRQRQLKREVDRRQIEIDSLTKQVEELRSSLAALPKDDQEVIAQHKSYAAEERQLDTWDRDLADLTRVIDQAVAVVSPMPTKAEGDLTLANEELVLDYGKLVREEIEFAKKELAALAARLVDTQRTEDRAQLRNRWAALNEAHEEKYRSVRERAQNHQRQLDLIADNEKRIRQLRGELTDHSATLSEHGDPVAEYEEARQLWLEAYSERAQLLSERCQGLTELSDLYIRASLDRGAGVKQAEEALANALEGTKIYSQAKKVQEVLHNVRQADDSVQAWSKLLGELENLAIWSEEHDDAPPEAKDYPELAMGGLTASDLAKVANALDVSTWLKISLTELEDEPRFEYRQADDEYIPFADASAGQQATALLRVLLNQEGPPLVIDQPEEDLDNEVIQQIVEGIWSAKSKRQILITSHNANLVVNGDADLVIVCGYRQGTGEAGGQIEDQGAIDLKPIRSSITKIMEGGDRAFRLRKEKYGF